MAIQSWCAFHSDNPVHISRQQQHWLSLIATSYSSVYTVYIFSWVIIGEFQSSSSAPTNTLSGGFYNDLKRLIREFVSHPD